MRTQPPLRCSDVLERLPLFVGEDLEGDLSRAVLAHLERCASCRGQEARARDARQRFRAVLDGSLAGLARPGLWPGIRRELVAEGRLPAGPGAQAPTAASPVGTPRGRAAGAPAATPAMAGPRSTTSPGPGPRATGSRDRLVRLIAPLAAAAAVTGLLYFGQAGTLPEPARGPIAGTPGAAAPGDARIAELAVGGASEAPVILASQPGGLRRVAAGEQALYQGAQPLRSAVTPLSTSTPSALSDTTLVHYR